MGVKIFIVRILQAIYGKSVLSWLKIHFKIRKDDSILVFSTKNDVFNDWILRYLNEYLEENYIERLFIIVNKGDHFFENKEFSKKVRRIIKISESRLDLLLLGNRIWNDNSIIEIQLNRKYGNKVDFLIGEDAITLEDIASFGALGLYNSRK